MTPYDAAIILGVTALAVLLALASHITNRNNNNQNQNK